MPFHPGCLDGADPGFWCQLIAWWAWPGSPDNLATSVDRVDVITIVLLLAGLPLLARRFFGPPGGSRIARFLRVGTYAAILALIPAKATVEQFAGAPPRGPAVLRLYRLIGGVLAAPPGWGEILFLVFMALYAAAILWMTSQRSRIAPATLATGAGAGIVLGVVMYAVAPLGLSNLLTNLAGARGGATVMGARRSLARRTWALAPCHLVPTGSGTGRAAAPGAGPSSSRMPCLA
jgi:hypothetical protein